MTATKRSIVMPALALAMFATAGYVAAQTAPTTPSASGSISPPSEVRRGVPGVDVDVNTRDRGANSGVPGVDVDVRNPTTNRADDDVRRSGAAAATDERMRADRN